MFNLPHPEAMPGEIWITNLNLITLKFKTKFITARIGQVAYSYSDEIVETAAPLFIQRSEADRRGTLIPYLAINGHRSQAATVTETFADKTWGYDERGFI